MSVDVDLLVLVKLPTMCSTWFLYVHVIEPTCMSLCFVIGCIYLVTKCNQLRFVYVTFYSTIPPFFFLFFKIEYIILIFIVDKFFNLCCIYRNDSPNETKRKCLRDWIMSTLEMTLQMKQKKKVSGDRTKSIQEISRNISLKNKVF